MSASKSFLQIAGVNGDSKDPKYRGWIDVLSWSLEAPRGAGNGSGGSREAAKTNRAVNFTIRSGAVSESLFRDIHKGAQFKDVILEAIKDNQLAMRVRFGSIYISSVSLQTSNGLSPDDAVVMVSIDFQSMHITYGDDAPKKSDNGWGCFPGPYGFQVCLPERPIG